MRRLTLTPTRLPGVLLIERERLADDRGAFSRLFCAQELVQAGWRRPIAQVNLSQTSRCGTVRGLHFQDGAEPEMKLVSCVRGQAWDVVVDLRAGSPCFLQHHAQLLSADIPRAVLVPAGCAHGFQSLSDDVELVYCHSAPFEAQAQRGVNACDPRLAIRWPLPVAHLSDRDRRLEPLAPRFAGLDS